ncbi:MAG: hypothetical protein O3B85_14800, partial [Planctomycetota bacterium]|nr:hypothetical protein [Planctomycetota bacterium]
MHHSRRTAIAASLLFVTTVTAQDVRSDRFERAVRPLLVARCVECHGPKKQKSGLRLDHGDFIRRGGARGPALIPGEPDQSLMIQAARCEHADLAMPPKGQLSADELAILEDWVEDGAYWPDEPAPSTSTDDRAPFDLDARRASHWCWDAPAAVEPPDVEDTRFVQN